MSAEFRLGLIVNPLAGIGGAVALKGSDGAETVREARARGAVAHAQQRTAEALRVLEPYREQLTMVTVAGSMGADIASKLGFNSDVVYSPSIFSAADTGSEGKDTSAEDTREAVDRIQQNGVDLLLFAGGDGTARDICERITEETPVLGIPAGCKIHSGVYALTPRAAGRVVEKLICGELTSLRDVAVMDIDEAAFRSGQLRARRYGEMTVPTDLEYVQRVKMAGRESEALVLHDIAAEMAVQLDEARIVVGSGSTVAAVMEELGLENTLLGVDLVEDAKLVQRDATEQQVFDFVSRGNSKLLITLIGGQGHLFGRGNQQLSPRVIRAIGRENISVVATKNKLTALEGRPLIADTGDPELDASLAGLIPVTTGYHDRVLYPLKSPV